MAKMKLALVQGSDITKQVLSAGEPRIRFGEVEFFGPYEPLQMAPVRERFRTLIGHQFFGAAICWFDVEIERPIISENVDPLF